MNDAWDDDEPIFDKAQRNRRLSEERLLDDPIIDERIGLLAENRRLGYRAGLRRASVRVPRW